VQLSRNADGNLLVLARYDGGSTVLYRYWAQGQVDQTFGIGGKISRNNQVSGAEQTLFMLRPADGSILVGSSASAPSGGYGSASMGTFSLLHFSADGLFDGHHHQTWLRHQHHRTASEEERELSATFFFTFTPRLCRSATMPGFFESGEFRSQHAPSRAHVRDRAQLA